MCGGPISSSKRTMSAEERKYRAEDDVRTLERAEEIRSDKSRMTGAVAHAKTQVRRMKRIAGAGRGSRRR